MKIDKRLIVVSIIIGVIGFLLQFTPLNNLQVPSGRRGLTASLPVVIMAAGFGTAGALIEISIKDKKRK